MDILGGRHREKRADAPSLRGGLGWSDAGVGRRGQAVCEEERLATTGVAGAEPSALHSFAALLAFWCVPCVAVARPPARLHPGALADRLSRAATGMRARGGWAVIARVGVYQKRVRDCYALEQSSGVPFPEWRRVVREVRRAVAAELATPVTAVQVSMRA